jgi:WD40 repeat protein/uncharacterized caspase-like protein
MPRSFRSMLRAPAIVPALLGTGLLGTGLLGIMLQIPHASAQERPRIEVVPQLSHSGPVEVGAFTRDGKHILTGGSDGTLKLWDVATTRLIRTFAGHKGDVTTVALSPDGSRAVSGSKDKTVRLWDVATGRLTRTIYAHLDTFGEVTSVAFSPDGTRVASGSSGEGAAKLWDADTGLLVRMFRHAKGSWSASIDSIAFSPDGARLATAGPGDQLVSIWSTDAGQLLQAFGEPISGLRDQAALAFSADGSRVLVGTKASVGIWDVAKGTLLRTLRTRDPKERYALIPSVAFLPDGDHAVIHGQSEPEIWNVASGQLIRSLKKSGTLLAISPDGTRLLSGGWVLSKPGNFALVDAASGQDLHSFGEGSARISSVAAFPDGARLITIDSKVRLWNAAQGRLERSIPGRAGSSMVLLPDGSRLFLPSYDGVEMWDVATGQLVRTVKVPHPIAVALSGDGARLVALGTESSWAKLAKSDTADEKVSLITWDLASDQAVHTVKVSTSPLSRVQVLSPDATRLLTSSSHDQPIKVWDVASGQAAHTFGGRTTNHLYSAALAPDNTRAATGHFDGSVKLWDLASGQLVRTLWHSRSVDTVIFSRDGRKLLSGGDDTTVKLWDTATGQSIRTFEGHSASVKSVAFTPDEKRVISGSADGTARVWDAATGEELAMLVTAKDEWLVITPEGFFDASPKGAEMLSVVRGLQVFGIDQFYQELYRPDLVREKLAGDPDGKVKAAARLDLGKLVDSGRVPTVTIVSHKAQETTPDDLVTVEAVIADQGGGIGKAEWRINGVTVGLIEKPAPAALGQPVSLKQAMALDPGENTVEVVAYNGANLVASIPARTKVTWTGTEPSVPPRLHVLTVGINAYLDAALRLKYAVPDAKSLAAAFSEAGRWHYESVLVTNVLDGDATSAKLDQAFTDLADKVRPRDVFVFFAAGHGKTLDGRYYFIPYDLRYQNEQSLARNAIGQDKLQAWFARIPAKKAVLMFDTCEAGTLTERTGGVRTAALTRGGLEQKAALGRLIQATGRATLTASSATQEAFEGHGGHGVFTFALLDSLARGDLNSNGLIELAELIQHVDGLVPAITEKRWGARQFPQMDAYGANFPVARQVAALAPAQDEAIIIPIKPTHVSAEPLQIFKEAGGSGVAIGELLPFRTVTLVKGEGEWALIARDGKLLGYVADARLKKLD